MNQQENGTGEISRFRAVVIAAQRAKQLRRGSKPRIEPAPERHKDTSIAVEEVRRGLIAFHPTAAMKDLKGAVIEEALPVVV